MTTTRRSAAPARSPRPDPLPRWGAVCFFASGAAGLLYEVVWSKQLAYLLGNSLHAVATVVAAFLCGLALGARFLGVALARRGQGPRTYAALELGCAVLGVLSLPVLRGLEPAVGQLYRGLGGEGPAFAFARFGLLFALLILPTALMGATLPVLVAHFERDRVGPALAQLYALNTFGAVAGSVAGGFALLPGLGLGGTIWCAAALNVAVAAIAWRSASPPVPAAAPAAAAPAPARPAARASGGAAPRSGEAKPLADSEVWTFALLFALSGFAALMFQIAWIRLFSLVFGSSVYSFSAVLGVYLLGLALGSAAVARVMRTGVSLGGFARLQLALAIVAGLELLVFSRLPDWMFSLTQLSGPRWQTLFLGEVGVLLCFLIVPCGLLGAAFPIATRLMQRRDGGHATGFAYAVNTAGTIAGSLFAGFYAVPNWGVQGTHLAALLLSGAIGVAALGFAWRRGESQRNDFAIGLVGAAMIGGLVVLAPRWEPARMSLGLFRPVQAIQLARFAQLSGVEGTPVDRATRAQRVLYYRDGVNGSVMVGANRDGSERWLSVGGKTDASTGDMETQALLGLVPAACADSGARALVIGLGSGVTAAGVLAAGAGPTTVVELEPGVVEASRFFFPPGVNPLDDPRVKLVRGDARTHLTHSGERYDLIVSEPSNPWIAGVNNLFTVDFYRRVRRGLVPDGVFCQWMQLYELSPETFRSMVASFSAVFPEGQVFSIWRSSDVLLVAMPPRRRLALERWRNPAAQTLLDRAKIPAPEVLTSYYAGPLSALAAAARGAPLNLDDRPIVEYRAPHDLIDVGRVSTTASPQVTALVPFASGLATGALFSDWTPERWYGSRARFLIAQGEITRATRVADGAQAAGFDTLSQHLRAEIAQGDRVRRSEEQVANARTFLAAGREAEGQRALELATEIDPDNGRAWLILSERRRRGGDSTGADAALERGRASHDPEVRAEAEGVIGFAELKRGNTRGALEHFRAAQRLSPGMAKNYLLEAQALFALGDVAGARAALQRGLAVAPMDAELGAALRALGPS